MTLNSDVTAPVTGALPGLDEDPDDSSYGWAMFLAFISAVLAITFTVCVLAMVGSWWMLGVAFAVDVGITALVMKVVRGALNSSDAYPDLERIAASDRAEVPALRGWRRELFGDKALALKHGKLALAIERNKVATVER